MRGLTPIPRPNSSAGEDEGGDAGGSVASSSDGEGSGLVEMEEGVESAPADTVKRLQQTVKEAQAALEEKPVASSRGPERAKPAVEERGIEGEVDLFEGEEEAEPMDATAVVVEEEVPVEEAELPVILAATEVEKLVKAEGEEVVLEGVVEQIGQSGSTVHWYLEFNKGTPDFLMVVFKHETDPGAGSFSAWEQLANKKVRVRGKAEMFNRAGKKPAVRLFKRENVEVLGDMTVRQVSEVGELFDLVAPEEEVQVEGTLTGFGKHGENGYLIFEEGRDVQARFPLAGGFGESAEFRGQLASLKGKKIRVTGVLRSDPQERVAVAIEIGAAASVVVAEPVD